MKLRETDRFRYRSGQPHLFWSCAIWPICESTIGADPRGNPQGTPGDQETKLLRTRCHLILDGWWESGRLTRRGAYRALQQIMNMSERDAHFGRFNAAQCREFLSKVTSMDLKEAHINVAGHQHYLDAALTVAVGQKVTLKKEPENQYDENAIAVISESGRHIGYIPRNRTAVFHLLMDAGAIQDIEIIKLKEPLHEHHIAIALRANYDNEALERHTARKT